MARVNIEEIEKDERFQELMIQLGSRHLALGVMVDLWKLAQKFWFPHTELIPVSVFERAKLPDALFQVGLAEKRADGVYAKGSKEQFAWLFACQAAGGTRKTGKRRGKKPAPSDDEGTLGNPEGTLGNLEGSSTSLLSSLFSSLISQNSILSPQEPALASADCVKMNSVSLFGFWNATCGDLPQARDFTSSRKQAIERQLKKYPMASYWVHAAVMFRTSEWLQTDFKPGLDEFLREDIRTKAIEGFYHRTNGRGKHLTDEQQKQKLMNALGA